MNITIQKWGNSQAIRIPKYILNSLGLQENDALSIVAQDNKIILEKQAQPQHISLKERLQGFDGHYIGEEWDTGEPVGKEFF